LIENQLPVKLKQRRWEHWRIRWQADSGYHARRHLWYVRGPAHPL